MWIYVDALVSHRLAASLKLLSGKVDIFSYKKGEANKDKRAAAAAARKKKGKKIFCYFTYDDCNNKNSCSERSDCNVSVV